MVSEKPYDAEWTLDVLKDLQNFFSANGMPDSEREAIILQSTIRNEINGHLSSLRAAN